MVTGKGPRESQRARERITDRVRGATPPKSALVSSLLLFLLGYLGLMAVLFLSIARVAKEPLNAWTARTTVAILRILGARVTIEGPVVTSGVYSFEVITECTALFPGLIFSAAVLAYPCSWRKKVIGVGMGVPALAAINLFRLVSLYYLVIWVPGMVETLHLIVWQSLMIFLTILLWLLWVRLVIYRGHPQLA